MPNGFIFVKNRLTNLRFRRYNRFDKCKGR